MPCNHDSRNVCGLGREERKMNCDKCVWYVVRMLTDEEAKYLRQNYPNVSVDTRFCVMGGCDGTRLFKEKEE